MKLWAGRLVRFLTLAATFAFLLLLCFLVLIRTAWFRDNVRQRIVTEVEKATGGTVSVGGFSFDPATLEVSVTDFTLRGREAADSAPLADVEKIRARIKVSSLFSRQAYLALLEVTAPRIRILTYPDGTTNIPGPKIRREGRTVFELFVSLAAREFVLSQGLFEYDNQRLPLDLIAENLSVNFGWDAPGKRYRGRVTADPFHVRWPKIAPLVFSSDVELTMDKDGLVFEKAESRSGRSLITATGTLKDYRAPKVDVDVRGQFVTAEWVKPLKLPIDPDGSVQFNGKFTYDAKLLLTGNMSATGLAVRQGPIAVTGIDVNSSSVRLDKDGVTVTAIQGTALGGTFEGTTEIRDWRDLTVNGTIGGLSLEQLRTIETVVRPVGWSSLLSGPVKVTGRIVGPEIKDLVVESDIELQPAPGKIPLRGSVHARYLRSTGDIVLRPSLLDTPRSHMMFSGSLLDRIQVRVDSEDLNEFLPAVALISTNPPAAMPVQLDGGAARFEGVVVSPTGAVEVRGRATATNLVYGKQRIDRVEGTVAVTAAGVEAAGIRATALGAQVEGSVKVAMNGWKVQDSSAIGGRLEVVKAPLGEVLRQAGRGTAPLSGDVQGAIELSGSVANPEFDARLALANAKLGGESFEGLDFDVDYRPDSVALRNGVARHGGVKIPFEAVYRHPPGNLDSGKLEFKVTAKDQALESFAALRGMNAKLNGRGDVEATGVLDVQPGRMSIDRLDGSVVVRRLLVGDRALGSFRMNAATKAQRISIEAQGEMAGAPFKGGGEWQLNGDSPGLGQLDFGTLSFATLRDIAGVFGNTRPIPFDGKLTGSAVVNGPLRKPDQLRARFTFTAIELQPSDESKSISTQVMQELALRNNGPVIFDIDAKGLQVAQAQLVGKDTNLQVAGGMTTGLRGLWNLAIKGGLNLGFFQNLTPGLRTAGAAVLNATVRGAIDDLQLGGRMEVKEASVYHRDFSNGIDKANGVVTFDRNRALLQNLTAQTGGGELKLSGFLTFPTKEEAMSYRLNGQMEKVRIRYPEGASTTVNANLSLTGNAAQSVLGGLVTVLRSGFNARTDIGAALLEPAKPVQTPTGNTILQGMQFDVRVNSAPNLQLETSLTSGLGATVDLRVRGSAIKPVILGNVAVTQGEINFFGTRYTITRGTVSFLNAARIQPVLDLDLETIVRAVTVNMNVSGPMDKLNITYRSDPPLHSQDIVALLAVGRTPGSTTVAPQSNVASVGTGVFAGTQTLLGQAMSAGVSSRLNRFFGVSRVKIDPQLTGLDSTPQARLTIEQQISRDITLTYVTNLTGALQQLVRLQWDVSRNWSVTATRDENGVIGADILVRRRFK